METVQCNDGKVELKSDFITKSGYYITKLNIRIIESYR